MDSTLDSWKKTLGASGLNLRKRVLFSQTPGSEEASGEPQELAMEMVAVKTFPEYKVIENVHCSTYLVIVSRGSKIKWRKEIATVSA